MNVKYDQEKFFNKTLSKIEKDLTKFIFETNFSNVPSLYLRDEISKFKKKSFKRSSSQNGFEYYNIMKRKIFPMLVNKRDPETKNKNSTIFVPLIRNKNLITRKQDINHIFVKDSLKNEIRDFSKKRYLKYSNEKRNNQLYHTQLYDKCMNTIIRNKDINQGLLDMINKGLIPKGSDVTPAFERDGNPFNITSTNFSKFRKTFNKSEVTNASVNKFRYRPEYNLEIFYKTFQPKYKKIDVHQNTMMKNNKELLTGKNDSNENNKSILTDKKEPNIKSIEKNYLSEMLNITSHNTENNNIKELNKRDNINSNNLFNKTSPYILINESNQRTFYDCIRNIDFSNNIRIKFEQYKLITDENFKLFKNKHLDNWNKIRNILGNFSILFEKLNLNKTEIDSEKILKLIKYYNDDIKLITNKDLLMCLSEKELKAKGINPEDERLLYTRIKELFIIRIQSAFRRRRAIRKYKLLKILNIRSRIIQSHIRGYLQRKKIKKEKEIFKNEIHNKYIEILNDFKKNYDINKEMQKIEIHINSLTYESPINCTIDKYMLKESLQLNRLIRLKHKNIKIIYILPFNLSEDILSYYYSTLEAVDIEDIKNRVEFIVPEACEYFPEYFSLSKLLYLSPKTLNIIKIKCKNKYSYIIPGMVGQIEEKISYLLDIPILMGNPEKINSLFNKSGIKSFLEINEIPFPMSAWDIKTSEEFYSSLAHLIAIYPSIRIWIMKSNNDINGRSISYLDTNKIDFIVQLKKEKKNNKHMTVELFQEKLYYQLKNIINKHIVFCYKNFYKNWDEYLENYLSNKGIIEACPTKYLDGIMGHPCIPMLIEPNGKIKILPSYEKIYSEYFKNIICTSPQENIDEEELNKIAKRLGTFFYHQNVIGYITIEFITFHDGKKVLYWCTDVIYGLTQNICDILYGYFLYNQSKEKTNKSNDFWKNKIEDNSPNKDSKELTSNDNNINTKNSRLTTSVIEEKNINRIITHVKVFNIPYIITEIIKSIKLKHFLRDYKYNNLIFDENTGEGVMFNFCDGLECGIFGLCGIINNDIYERINLDYKLWKLIDNSLNALKNSLYKVNKKAVLSSINKQVFGNLDRTDITSIHLIFSRVKKILKNKEIEAKKEEARNKKIADEQYL